VRGAWTGADLADQAAAGLVPDADGMALLRRRLGDAAGVPPSVDVTETVLAAHRALAASPAALVVATLEDAMLVAERPNNPRAARDNWSRALPSPIESLRRDPFVGRLVRALHR
jgi:4-alpha-glucanotransferase